MWACESHGCRFIKLLPALRLSMLRKQVATNRDSTTVGRRHNSFVKPFPRNTEAWHKASRIFRDVYKSEFARCLYPLKAPFPYGHGLDPHTRLNNAEYIKESIMIDHNKNTEVCLKEKNKKIKINVIKPDGSVSKKLSRTYVVEKTFIKKDKLIRTGMPTIPSNYELNTFGLPLEYEKKNGKMNSRQTWHFKKLKISSQKPALKQKKRNLKKITSVKNETGFLEEKDEAPEQEKGHKKKEKKESY